MSERHLHPLLAKLFLPLSSIYEMGMSVRNRFFDWGLFPSYESQLPVMSVGNIALGGSGKTPLTSLLVEELRARHYHPVVLTRGYGGQVRDVQEVHALSQPSFVGDEPLYLHLKHGVPVVVAPRRVRGAKFIEEHELGDLIILDDGLQHRWLRREVNILCLNLGSEDSQREILSDRTLPSGFLRETLTAVLPRVQIVIAYYGRPLRPEERIPRVIRERIPERIPIFRATLEPKGFHALEAAEELPLNQPVLAFTGIARPNAFFESLLHLGMSLKERVVFPDHEPYSPSRIAELRKRSEEYPLVCTEKDAVKLRGEGLTNVFVLESVLRMPEKEDFFYELMKLSPKLAFQRHEKSFEAPLS